MTGDLLIIMARYPVPGKVKTRLAAEIGKAAACRVYRGLLTHHAREFVRCPFDVEWRYTPVRAPFRRLVTTLGPAAPGRRVRFTPQPDGDLGARMSQIFGESFEAGYRRVVMIGTDAPLMGRGTVQSAFDHLVATPAVFQPTEDGGYALVGLTTMLNVFSGIDWSTERVMNQTRSYLARHRIQHAELPVTWDLDTGADLARASAQLQALGGSRSGQTR